MKVLKTFYCIKTNKKYFKGDDYKGSRKDLVGYLEQPKKRKNKSKK